MKVRVNGKRSFISCASFSSAGASTRSILLIASATVAPWVRSDSDSRMRSTPSVRPRCASISRTTMSASATPPQAAATMARSSRRRGWNRPGVSTKTICAAPSIATPRIRARVVCTLWVTIDTLAPTMRFSSVDFPALGSPIRATKPARVGPSGVASGAAVSGVSSVMSCPPPDGSAGPGRRPVRPAAWCRRWRQPRRRFPAGRGW